MFLHKDNFNIREWNRLSHFNDPFGFMGLKYKPLLLPKPGGDGCVHCAVVGTGGILNGSKMGTEIDAHDYVFRMNGAVINGYEEDVGTKTSVYVHTAHSITASLEFFKEYGYKSAPHDEGIKYVLIPEGLRDFQWLQGLLKGEKVSSGEYQDQEFIISILLISFLCSKSVSKSKISSFFLFCFVGGFFLLKTNTMYYLCSPQVSAYGFMTEDYSKYSNYYAEKLLSEVTFYINHDLILEKNLWKSFHDKKILKLYQRTGSEKQTDS
uniref:alpha-N-acetylgalactosaminide alpha-2,6-sialyltransferase n=1 Tax=Poecilia latipinna TaxID=48699 RepID=A0A3B3TK27_9TELE